MNSIFKAFVVSLAMVSQVHFAYSQNAAILPNAMKTFVDANGKPLTSGTVDYYIPGTSTRKSTWQDIDATILNSNPVQLNAAGRALIWGNGSYREVVKDRNGNLQWDRVTSSAGAGGSSEVTVGDGLSVGTLLNWSGFVAPVNYAFAYGQEISRTTYSTLLNNITLVQDITCVSGNPTLTNVADTSQLNVGGAVEAACVSPGATILSKTSNTVTISSNAIVSTTVSARFFPFGAGNGTTTFNVPDYRGYALVGRNNMGGSSSVRLSTPYYTDPNSLFGTGGSQSFTLLSSNLPSYTPTGTNSGGAATFQFTTRSDAAGGGANTVVNNIVATGGSTLVTTVFTQPTFAGNSINGGIAVSATVAAGGSGYSPGTQLLTLSGGTCTTQPQFNVTVAAGAITSPVLVTAGDCSVVPTNPVATTGGGGTSGTLNVVWAARPFSLIQPSKTTNIIIKISPDVSLSVATCGNLTDAGTACSANTGTSGHTLPYLDGNNTFSGANTFGSINTSGGGTLTGFANPSVASQLATKAYVDSVATGLNILAQTKYATAAVLPNSPTYNNGASGVGATLTAGANSTLTVDGNVVALNEVVLVKNQASTFQNGIYTLTQAGSGAAPWILTRATYFDQAAEMLAGSYTFVTNGATNAASSYTLQTTVTTVGTDPLIWLLFSSSVAGVSQIDGTQGVITVSSGSLKVVSGQLTSNVFATRTFAATQNLTSFSTIQTLGYNTAGDGGGGVFQKIGSAPFKDTYVTAGTIAAGSSYINGTYDGVRMTGGQGQGCMARVTVAGTVVTAVDISGNYCAAYGVGDVLTPFNGDMGGSGSGATYTVTTITTPLGSFTDASANRWQLVTDKETYPNVKQFGAKLDWAGSDGTATNDLPSFQSAMAYTNIENGSAAAVVTGGKLMVPKGASLLCAGGTPFQTLLIPKGVILTGAGPQGGSTLKQCDAENASVHFITLCDPNASNSGGGQFGCAVKDISLYAPASSNAATVAIYSNSGQQFPLVDNVYINTGTRGCIKYEIGKGGASNAIFQNIDCERSNVGANNAGAVFDSSNTQIVLRNAVFGCAPGVCGAGLYAIGKIKGNLVADTVHIENHTDGVVFSGSSTDLSSARNFTIGSGCVNGITLQNSNPNNTVLVENIQSGCSTATVLNQHTSGSNVTGNILAQRVFNP